MKNLYIAVTAIFSMGWANSIQASEIEQIINFKCVGNLNTSQPIQGDRKELPETVNRLNEINDEKKDNQKWSTIKVRFINKLKPGFSFFDSPLPNDSSLPNDSPLLKNDEVCFNPSAVNDNYKTGILNCSGIEIKASFKSISLNQSDIDFIKRDLYNPLTDYSGYFSFSNPGVFWHIQHCVLTDQEGFLQTATEDHHIKLYKIIKNEDGTYQLTFGYNPGKTRKAFDKKKIEHLIPEDVPENLKKIDDYWEEKYHLVIIKAQPILAKKAS